MDDEKLGRVVMLCWAIWSARNDFLWKNRVRSVKNVVEFAQSSLHQFLKAQGKSNLPPLSPPKPGDGSEVWIKPTVGIKLNVDATLFEQDLKHGFGCVIRNTEGELISAFAGAKQGKVAPEIAEAMGIREALSWLKNHNYSHAAVESDSLVCVDAIRSNEKLNWVRVYCGRVQVNPWKFVKCYFMFRQTFCESCHTFYCPTLFVSS